jgi:excisionase family DNA binding protein
LIWKSQERLVQPTKTLFSTLEAAKACKISEQEIIQRFDSGQLKGYRLPGSRDRRIPREALLRFMEENGMPDGRAPEQAVGNAVSVRWSRPGRPHGCEVIRWPLRDLLPPTCQ